MFCVNILKHRQLIFTRAVAEVTRQYGGDYIASAVGEAHVVELMKKTTLLLVEKAMVGGFTLTFIMVVMPWLVLHYSSRIYANKTVCFCFAKPSPNWLMRKEINLTPNHDVESLLNSIANSYTDNTVTRIDGVKIDFQMGGTLKIEYRTSVHYR